MFGAPTLFKQVKNNAKSVVLTNNALNNTTNPKTFSLRTGEGARFPSFPGNPFYVTAWDKVHYPDPFDDPRMRIGLCTARSGDAMIVLWGQLGTPVIAMPGKPAVELLLVDQHLIDLCSSLNNIEIAMPQIFNVVSYGAKGDGSSDDTGACQDAYDDWYSKGGSGYIWVPKPTAFYRIAGQTSPSGSDNPRTGLLIPSGAPSIGSGRKQSILRTDAIPAGSGENWFSMFSNPNLVSGTDSDISFVSLGVELPAPRENSVAMERYDVIASFNGASNVKFFDCWGKNGGIGFQALRPAIDTPTVLEDGHSDNNEIDHCIFENVTSSMAFSGSTNCKFTNNICNKAWDDVLLIGSAGRGHRILHNKMSGLGAVSGKGSCSGVISLHNDGGRSTATDSISDILISDCSLTDAYSMQLGKRSGINFFGGVQDVTIEDCGISGNQWGIACNDGDRKNIKILFSRITRNIRDGVLINANINGGSVKGIKLIGNKIADNGANGGEFSGVNITANLNAETEVEFAHNDFEDDELTTQKYSISAGSEEDPTSIVTARIVHNDLQPGFALHEFGGGLSPDSIVRDNNGLADPEIFATTSFSIKKPDGTLGSKLIIDGAGRLFIENDGISGGQDLTIATAFDNDKGVTLRYIPGTVGGGAGVMILGQIDKNNPNYTHGVTKIRVNGVDQIQVIDKQTTINGGLDFNSTTRVLTLPRLTTTQKNALTPTNGMVVYDTTLNKTQAYEAGVWVNLV